MMSNAHAQEIHSNILAEILAGSQESLQFVLFTLLFIYNPQL